MFEQFYHTRCRAEESVIGQEEFSVRAASLSAEQIMARRLHLELADLAIYELPTSSRNRIPGNDENAVGRPPVRLARVKMRSGTEAVVHSVVRTDPQRVYFSHIILPHDGTAALPASECVSLWGLQSMWGSETGCVWTEPQGLDISRSKTLPHWAPPGEDVQPIVSPEAVRRFLEGEPVAIPSGNASLDVSPARIRNDEHRGTRRLLLENILAAFLNGQRVLLIAEPGLAALLVYSVTLLLPRRLTDSATFSTFEPPGHVASKRLDFINTVGGDNARLYGSTSSAGETVLIDTFAVDMQTFAANSVVSSYASFAVDRLQQSGLSDLADVWRTLTRVVGAENLTRKTFVAAWQMIERLWRIESKPLSDSELSAYVSRPEWRQLLFETPRGRFQAVRLAIRGQGSIPQWWPESPHDDSKRRILQPHLSDFQEQMISAIVEELEHPENSSIHLGIANFGLGRLLPGVADDEMTMQEAFTRIVDRLQKGDDGSQLSSRLPWTTRRAILRSLAKQSRHEGPQQRSLIHRARKWLHLASIDELHAIQGEDVPSSWKARAVAVFVTSRDDCDAVIARLLLNDQAVFNDTFGLLTETLSGSPARLKSIVVRLFNAVPSVTDRERLCYSLFKTGLLSQCPQLKNCFDECVSTLINGDSQLHFLFADERDLNDLVDAIGIQADTSAHFWAACCRNLDDSCLDAKSESNRMLVGLFRTSDAGKLHWPANDTRWSQRLEHWRRVHSALYEQLPVGEQWYAFRWSLKALEIQSPEVLGRLLRRAVTNGQVGEPSEIVECAKTLLPNGAGIVRLANTLVAVTQSLPDEMKSEVQVVLLSEACQETCEHYEQVLGNKPQLGLSANVEVSLRDRRMALLQRAREAQLEASKRTRFRDCVACFGLPAGLVAAALLVFVCLALWSQRSIFGPAGFAALCLFVVGGLSLAFFQGWTIYKIRTGRMDSFDVRNKPRTSRRQRNRRSSPPVAGPSVKGSDDARQPPD